MPAVDQQLAVQESMLDADRALDETSLTGRRIVNHLRSLQADSVGIEKNDVRRNPCYRPLFLCDADQTAAVERLGIAALGWRRFLLAGPVEMGSS